MIPVSNKADSYLEIDTTTGDSVVYDLDKCRFGPVYPRPH